MKILNALDLKAGKKAEHNRMGVLTQPVQFLPYDQKDEDWGAWNLDWLEQQGLKQVKKQARRMLKNYKLANGIIDRTDYIVEEDNEAAEMIELLTREDAGALELKFFPIIPNVINVMVGEFAKRSDKIMYRAVDDTSYNEMLAEKLSEIEGTLIQQAEQKMLKNLEAMGVELDSEEAQQAMSPDNLKSLPEIENFYKKDYRSMIEQWATHQHNADMERFHIHELEMTAFKDMLANDREFWHFKLNEDDYEIELWNPILTFYHKTPEIKYVSQGNYVGKFDLASVADVIDKYGWMMTEEQVRSLESIYPVSALGYILPGVPNDGSMYDATRSHEWNTQGPSLAMRQFTTFNDYMSAWGDDIVSKIYSESEDTLETNNSQLLRILIAYWKSQRKVGWLTKIDPDTGMMIQTIVTEKYKITDKPIYDTSLIKRKSQENLLVGEHIEWIWINQVWGGIKIGPNRPSYHTNDASNGMQPIYLNVKPVPFQFKGDTNIYGCKLPVEGCVFTDRNTKSVSLVDKMKPFQIGYNLVNNQISDLLIDELGTVVLFDQNTLPQESMGEDWGRNNLAKAYVAMKNFQMLPLDTSLTNTESPVGFQHYQVLNMEQTNRLVSRINLANYFKQQAFETVGITQQRLGNINAQETATGVEQAVNMSYSQTEVYFMQHSEHLMPRVHQMRTDVAQYYHSRNPSVRLTYMTSADEKVNFEMNGIDLLARDLNVFVTTKVNQKYIMEQIRNLAITNNTAGASIYDLGHLIKADSIAELDTVLKRMEEKVNAQQQQASQTSLQQEQMAQEAENARLLAEQEFEAEQNELDRQTQIQVAEIRASVAAGTQDMDNNNQNDYIDAIKYLDDKRGKDEDRALKRETGLRAENIKREELGIKREELAARKEIAQKQLQVARENKNKHDVPKKKK